MSQAVTHLLEQVSDLSDSEFAELLEAIAVDPRHGQVSEAREQEHLDIVRRRVAEVEDGSVQPLDGDEVMNEVRALVS